MSTVQTLLVIGAIFLLGIMILTMHSSIAVSQETSIKNAVMNESIIHGQEKLNEISVKSFAGVDAYNDSTETIKLSNGETYTTTVSISYVNPANPNNVYSKGTTSSMKRIAVTVTPDSSYRKTIFANDNTNGMFTLYYYKSN